MQASTAKPAVIAAKCICGAESTAKDDALKFYLIQFYMIQFSPVFSAAVSSALTLTPMIPALLT
jgi:hypothetical protein